MPITSLTIGPVHTLTGPITGPPAVPAVIYAMPARKVTAFVTPDTSTIQVGNLSDMSDAVTLTGLTFSEGQFVNSAAFIRLNTADATATIKLAAD